MGFNLIRQTVLGYLDLAQDSQTVIDSLPIPVVQFHLVPSSTGDWREHGASFGKVPSKKQTIFGYKLRLFVTLGGVIVDFELAPANGAGRWQTIRGAPLRRFLPGGMVLVASDDGGLDHDQQVVPEAQHKAVQN